MRTLDLLGAVELTMSAAIVVAGVALAIGNDSTQRFRSSAVLAGWFVIVAILAATRALHDEHGIGSPGVGLAVALPMALMWLALMRVPSLRQGLDQFPLAMLVAVHAVRVLGANFLLLQASHRLPAPFAPVAGWGDIVAGISAIPVAWLVFHQGRGWRTMLIAWNLFGLADLVAAVTLGVLSSPGPLRRIFAEPGAGIMSTLPWLLIPGFLVPLLATIHLAIFYRLANPASVPQPNRPTT